ncbi:MAG: TM2 domain-containing protein [Spirochaetaceae bacterium]|nr:TM2 domain-containing protein [Spirochaetaceae bacterium]
MTNSGQTGYVNPVKSKTVAYLFLFLTGIWGGHHFYLGRPGKGLLYLFTSGLFFLGWIYDLFTLDRQVDDINLKNIYREGLPPRRIIVSHETPNARPLDMAGVSMAGFSAEKQVLMLSGRSPVLTVRQVVAGTNLDVEEAESTLAKLAERGIARLRIDRDGRVSYDFG